MKIYCCSCETEVEARLTNGMEVYPHRDDLSLIPFWKCDTCNQFVGCHHKSKNRTHPLGVIPTPEIKKYRSQIHAKLDPIWKSGKLSRSEVYKRISKELGYEYHTAKIRSVNEAEIVLGILDSLIKKLT